MKKTHKSDFAPKLAAIASGPLFPGKEFILGKYTYEDILKMAGFISKALEKEKNPVCLCSRDKGIIAASAVSAIFGGHCFVLPFAYSKMAVKETCRAADTGAAITDDPQILPAKVRAVIPEPAGNSDFCKKRPPCPNSIFLKFFTGGSTGKPKMISKTFANIFGEAFFLSEKFKFTKDDIILGTVPPYHIYGFLYSVLVPFVSSSRVVENICVFPQEMRDAVKEFSPTVFVSVPIHYRIFNKSKIKANCFKMAFSSASPLDQSLDSAFYENTGAKITEVYGSTETGIIAKKCAQQGEKSMKAVEAVKWKISGDRLMVKSSFISPDLKKDKSGYYLTEDRVKPHGKNGFFVLGRAGSIVKTGGKRIDLDYIKSKIKELEYVEDAVVMAQALENARENEIFAVIQANTDEKKIQKDMGKILDPVMRPKKIKIVRKIPVKPTGKYDKDAMKRLWEF